MSEGKMQKVIWLEISNARIESIPTKNEGVPTKVEGATTQIESVPTKTECATTQKPAPTQKLQAQFKADKSDKEPTWWDVAVQGDKVESTYRLLVEAIDKKRLVLGELGVNGQELHIANYRIQFTEVSR